jgi:AraC-like DNA-binding protein
MQRGGTIKLSDPRDYQAIFPRAKVDLVFSCERNFEAQVTWVRLRHLHLIRTQENLPRVAHIALAPDLVSIAFPTRRDSPQTFEGVEVQLGDIVCHTQGGDVHQLSRGPSQSGFISLSPEHLAAYGKALTGFELVAPSTAQILRPARSAAVRLLHIHAKACHLAETKPELLAHPEVARALEQDLLHALIHCLTKNDDRGRSTSRQHHAEIIARFEKAFKTNLEQNSQIPELCAIIGASERTLRECCTKFLGMSPSRYLRLQRLNMVRVALRRADASTGTVAEVARRYGFYELGRFAGIYRTVFGEMPSTTLRSSRCDGEPCGVSKHPLRGERRE